MDNLTMKFMIIFFCFLLIANLCITTLMVGKDIDACYNDSKKLDRLVNYGEVEDYVILQLHDMKYACGECLALYRVDKIVQSENNEYNFYFNKEISVSFLNKKIEERFYKFSCESEKSSLLFSGYYRRNSLGAGRLDVTDGQFVCGN